MNTDKAYVLGFVIGSATFGTDSSTVTLNLPLRRWGAASPSDPNRAGEIARDILTRLNPVFNNEYGIQLAYHQSDHAWVVTCEGNIQLLANELEALGVAPAGELRTHADISTITPLLADAILKAHFLGGLADSIGSLAPSHRRFDDEHQIISFEFKGFNFRLVSQICQLFHELECYPDQILWNHPNQHSGNNPYYKTWKKGNKLRVLLDDFMSSSSFLFGSKAEGARQNISRQTETQSGESCLTKEIRLGPVCIHRAQNSTALPVEVRGYVVLHHKQVCAMLGCPYAPVDKLRAQLVDIKYFVSPFPILFKGRLEEVQSIVRETPIMANRIYYDYALSRNEVSSWLQSPDQSELLFALGSAGYPMNMVLQAIAYVIAANEGNVSGRRVRGAYVEVVRNAISSGCVRRVTINRPDKFTPLIVQFGEYAALVGPQNPEVYQNLLIYDGPLAVRMRQIEEGDI